MIVYQRVCFRSDHHSLIKRKIEALVISVCTTPLACSLLFVCIYWDIAVLKYGMMIVAVAIMSFPVFLKAIAGYVTAQSQRLVKLLIAFAFKNRDADVVQQRRLLLILESVSDERHAPLALRSAMGQTCTGLAFVAFLAEVAAQFTLVYSFSSFLQIRVS